MFVIYKATNVINGKSYIGQTVDFPARKGSHKVAAEKGCDCVFYRAIRKYGWDAFKWSILIEDDDCDQEWIDWCEVRMIAMHGTLLPNGYNMTAGGGGISGLVHSEETKRKMSDAAIGKPKSEQHRKSLSEALMGKQRSPFTEETKRRMSLSQTGKKCPDHVKQRLSERYSGKTLEEIHGVEKAAEIRAKLSEIRMGHPTSQETRDKIRDAQKGRPFSEDHKQKLRDGKALAKLDRFLKSGHKLNLTEIFRGG